LEAVSCAGISTAYFVVGYESERVIAKARQLIPRHITASFIVNRDWEKQNGISLLAAAGHVSSPFLLTMGDHVLMTRLSIACFVTLSPVCLTSP
jgi:1L-myo-inositol 1-phosphate cytidylyltransferase